MKPVISCEICSRIGHPCQGCVIQMMSNSDVCPSCEAWVYDLERHNCPRNAPTVDVEQDRLPNNGKVLYCGVEKDLV